MFNALNAISAALYEDPRVADEMIGRLGELLRQLLKDDRSQFVPLWREIETLQLYTRIMEARFEDRLNVSIEVDDEAGRALVPHLILQPLVENAIHHGMDSQFQARIVIHARVVDEQDQARSLLCLTVRDSGSGIDNSKPLTLGVGLGNTVQRLQRLYENRQSLNIRNAPEGGAIVEIHLPFRTGSDEKNLTTHPLVAKRGAVDQGVPDRGAI